MRYHVAMASVVNINDVLDGHVALELECVDRLYLNVYVPNLQVGGQVDAVPDGHLGNPIPSPVADREDRQPFPDGRSTRFAERRTTSRSCS